MGRRNCSRCGRWRHAHDYPYRFARVCACCEREEAERERIRSRGAKLVYNRARRRVERGEAVWAGPLREWLVQTVHTPLGPMPRHQWRTVKVLARWADVDERMLRKVIEGEALTLDLAAVDRCLLRDGSVAFNTLYPPEAA